MNETSVPIRLVDLLPLAQKVAHEFIDSAVNDLEMRGESIACKSGCAACCRHMVPLAEVEARRIAELVAALPESRQSEIRTRFAEALPWLKSAGLLERLWNTAEWNEGSHFPPGWIYFQQGIACPFLEDELCSIYEDRPIACREHLVTSAAEHCSDPDPETVRKVPLRSPVWRALAKFDEPAATSGNLRWVPLILALEWTEAHREEASPRLAAEWIRELFQNLTSEGTDT